MRRNQAASALLMLLSGTILLGVVTILSPTYKQSVFRPKSKRAARIKTNYSNNESLVDKSLLLSAVQKASKQMVERLKLDYGEYYDKILGVASQVFQSDASASAHAKLKRKFQMAALTGDEFVFAVAGHSSSAGKGNYQNETYAAVLARAVGPVFRSMNVTFTTRNYGMSAMRSAPELALCIDQVYGTDLDVLVWDFSLTDGKDSWRQQLFASRAALNSARPVLLAMHLKDRQFAWTQELADFGLSTIGMNSTSMENIKSKIPDMFGRSDEQINRVEPAVRNFKCMGRLEMGDPYCTTEKFTIGECPNRRHRESWHPGWKSLALSGNLLAVYFVETLIEALNELPETPFKASQLLQELEDAQSAEDNDLLRRPAPTLPLGLVNLSDTTFLYRQRSLCHTAKLPSQIRRTGILTGRTSAEFDTHYREGIERSALGNSALNNGSNTAGVIEGGLRLVYNNQARETCIVETAIDYSDFFAVTETSSFVFPTSTEQHAYGFTDPIGFIAICLVPAVPLDTFTPQGDEITLKDIVDDSAVKFTVNGQRVTQIFKLMPDQRTSCFALVGQWGHFWTPNPNKEYEIKFEMNSGAKNTVKPNSMIPISSIVIM